MEEKRGLAARKKGSREAFEEFTTLWLDQFDQELLPTDSVLVLCALTSASRHVPGRTRKHHLAEKWTGQVEHLLQHHHIFQSHQGHNVHHFGADEMLNATQRLSKLSAKDAVVLVNGVQEALVKQRLRHTEAMVAQEEAVEALKGLERGESGARSWSKSFPTRSRCSRHSRFQPCRPRNTPRGEIF